MRQPLSIDLTRVAPGQKAARRGHESSRIRTAPAPVVSPIRTVPSSSEVLRLQCLAGNRAVGRYLAGQAGPKIGVQRFIDESEAKGIFPNLAAFTPLNDESKNAFRAALGRDESADQDIGRAFRDMLTTIAGITLKHRDGQQVIVNGLTVEISLKWQGNRLRLTIASPPNVKYDQRTFGLVREVAFNETSPYVYETRMDIGTDYQGGGAGAVITRSGLALAEALGISKLKIEASSVGTYAWAAMGFEPDEGEWDRIASAMMAALESNVPKQWPQETATPVVMKYLPPVDHKATGDALAKEIRENQDPESPKIDLDNHLAEAAIAALKPSFLTAAKTITDDDDFLEGREIPEGWIDLLTEDDLATYLAKKALSQLLSDKGFRAELTTILAPAKRLGASTLPIGQDPPTEHRLPHDVFERLLEIISPDTRAGHSLNDVVVLARQLKDTDAQSAMFIRGLVMRSATWTGSAKLDDQTVMERFKKSVGWKA